MLSTKVGRLNNRITIQAATLTPDGQGGNRESWTDALYVWAEARPGGSFRTLERSSSMILADVTFRIRSGTGIGKLNRIIYEGRACIIEGIRDWEQNMEFQFIECKYDTTQSVSPTGSGIDSSSAGIRALNDMAYTVGSLTIQNNNLINRTLLSFSRNGIELKRVASNPGDGEYTFNSTTGTLTMNLVTGLGEYYSAIYV